ncbi:MAG TPA: VWA domain-containing protein [Anaerolineales bacterium]|jgi:Ca-activated chloride channel family protein|nr:VWA domain-containing protein [Anaerolineales bacterium]
MSFLWPGFLYLFFLIPLGIGVYLWILRRRRRFAVRYSSLALVREAAAKQSWLRKHLPFVLFLLALSSLILALTRPVATVVIPSNEATVILAMDVSLSMCSTDIAPNRLEVAKESALSFIRENSSGRQVGLVAFAGFAELIQPPTTDLRLLEKAIDSLVPARRTAIGSAILRSIDAIAEVDERVAPSELRQSTDIAPTVTEGEYVPHIVVLLTDGASNAGPFPLNAAEQAVERGIRVYTIGFGTVNNSSPMNCGDGDLFGFGGFGSPFEQFGGGGGGFRREIDEETLKQIADLTGGEYYAATSASELLEVFRNLPTYVIATRETTEISVFFTAFAILMAILALVLALRWHPLP